MARSIRQIGAEYTDSGFERRPATSILVLNADGSEFGTFASMDDYEAQRVIIEPEIVAAEKAAMAAHHAERDAAEAAYKAKNAAIIAARGDKRPSFLK